MVDRSEWHYRKVQPLLVDFNSFCRTLVRMYELEHASAHGILYLLVLGKGKADFGLKFLGGIRQHLLHRNTHGKHVEQSAFYLISLADAFQRRSGKGDTRHLCRFLATETELHLIERKFQLAHMIIATLDGIGLGTLHQFFADAHIRHIAFRVIANLYLVPLLRTRQVVLREFQGHDTTGILFRVHIIFLCAVGVGQRIGQVFYAHHFIQQLG